MLCSFRFSPGNLHVHCETKANANYTLLHIVFYQSMSLIKRYMFRFQGPDLLCRAVKFGQVFPIYLSSFILTLMAVDRVGVTGGGSSHARSGRKARRRLASSMSSATSLFGIGQVNRKGGRTPRRALN